MSTSIAIDRLMEPVGACLTPEVAQRLLRMRADHDLQERVDYLAERSNRGELTSEERHEYEQYVRFSQFITLLQFKARDVV
ncbi:hypothetical protein [Lacunimicrobium album]